MSYILTLITLHTLIIMVNGDFELTILHTNDCHARIEEFSEHISACSGHSGSQCFGGVARRYTAIQTIRKQEKNVLLLDAGDQYTGTLWFDYYKGDAAAKFMNLMKYDAMTLGNHEFDNGPEGLHPFLRKVKFPVVTANLDFTDEATWPSDPKYHQKSVILNVNGKQIGIIGYLTEETKWLSPSGNVTFSPIAQAVRREVNRLKKKGIDIFIALGHAGFATDSNVVAKIEDIDVIVGGHSNTFLFSGKPPSSEIPEGPYPVVFGGKKKTLLVHDYAYGKYLGYLKVIFDDNGNIKSWQGNPILLNSSFHQNQTILNKVANMSGPVEENRKKGVGFTLVTLDGNRANCRVRECNLGNLIADAIALMNNVPLGIWNSGSIRASIRKEGPKDPISSSDLFDVSPFANTADKVAIRGKYLKQVFEHSVSGLPDEGLGRFLQVSGFRVQYDISRKVGERVVGLTALCTMCRESIYKPVQDDKVYKVVTSSYIIDGGDGYSMFKNIISRQSGEDVLTLLENFIRETSPVSPTVEGRILFVDSKVFNKSTRQLMSELE